MERYNIFGDWCVVEYGVILCVHNAVDNLHFSDVTGNGDEEWSESGGIVAKGQDGSAVGVNVDKGFYLLELNGLGGG